MVAWRHGRFLLDISVWSADLANWNLSSGASRRSQLFTSTRARPFRPISSLLSRPHCPPPPPYPVEFHLHLMATRPSTSCLPSSTRRRPRHPPVEIGKRVSPALDYVLQRGKKTGLSLDLDTELLQMKDFTRGSPSPRHWGLKWESRAVISTARLPPHLRTPPTLPAFEVFADGGIREHTVPQLRHAGAHGIVPDL